MKQVPIATLKALAEKVSTRPDKQVYTYTQQFEEYEREKQAADTDSIQKGIIEALDRQVRDYERTNGRIAEKYRSALADRTKFARSAEEREVTSVKELEKLQKTIEQLEAANTRLSTASNIPDGFTAVLEERDAKVKTLEKRLQNAQQEAEYARTQYQTASSEASSKAHELRALQEEVSTLREEASSNRVRIHEIQAENTTHLVKRQVQEFEAQIHNRDMELARANDELRQLRNGRRETRGASVPRSPRMAMMSPRTGRTVSSAASRGTSPAPMYDSAGFLTQPQGNARLRHLRD